MMETKIATQDTRIPLKTWDASVAVPFQGTTCRQALLLLFLTENGFLAGGSGTTITHITQNNTTIKRNTAHKITHTIKDTLHRMNTNTTTII
jgi:hypothetical protein